MKPDMSPKAISTRLRRVAQLNRVCQSLSKAKLVSPSQTQVTSRKTRTN